MQWKHTCSLDWMQERQRHLTASDIKKLIPVTNTGRTRKITETEYMQVLASKRKVLTADDCVSTGAAARGHHLEPYAIKEFNAYAERRGWPVHLEHWDDCVAHLTHGSHLAFSPDAMNVAQNASGPLVTSCLADTIGEVKSYSTEHHIKCLCTDPMKLEERWQIATAMASAGQIMSAYLIFYDPSISVDSLGIVSYDRSMLADEIQIILDINKQWTDFISAGAPFPSVVERGIAGITEQQIIAEIQEQESKLNPAS